MSVMSISFICNPQAAAGLQTSSRSAVSSPSSSSPTRGLKRAREEDEQAEVDTTTIPEREYEDKGSCTKRRKVQAGPAPSSPVAFPKPVRRYLGIGRGIPITCKALASRVLPYKSPRHPVWKTASALQGLPSPVLVYESSASGVALPPFSSLLGGDFTSYPLSGAGMMGLGITVDLHPLVITPDEIEV